MTQAALDALADGVVLAGPDGRVTAINAVAAGCSASDAAGARRAARSRTCSPSRTTTAAPGARQLSLRRPGDPHRRARAVLAAARRHRGARRRPAAPRPRSTSRSQQVAVSIRSGRGRARLDRERSDLVATVAHELRSPLTGVKGFVQALLNRWDKLNDEQKKLMLTTVSADADRLSRLIAELLDVARIDTGRLQLHPRPVDAEVLVRRVVDSVAAGTSRPILFERGRRSCPQVTVDPDKFVQVVTNLVENAVRHGSGHGPVASAARPRPAPRACGWSSRTRARASPPSCAAGCSRSSGRPAAAAAPGLGLYLVHGLVEAHGGTSRSTTPTAAAPGSR